MDLKLGFELRFKLKTEVSLSSGLKLTFGFHLGCSLNCVL